MKQEAAITPIVYRELQRMAQTLMAGERAGHTLDPTALTHEVWLRLKASRNAEVLDHTGFMGLAAQAMRHILTEHARQRGAAKRGGDFRRTTLAGKAVQPELTDLDLALDLDAAVHALESLDPELARIVELRFFGGRGTEEIAAVLGVSARTVKRRWRFARAWLQVELQEGEE